MEPITDQPQTQNTYITAQTPYMYQSLPQANGSHRYYIWNQDGHLFHKWKYSMLINWKLGNINSVSRVQSRSSVRQTLKLLTL